jgi:hypothetical protein
MALMKKLPFALGIISLISACATVRVTVEATASSPLPVGKTLFVMPADSSGVEAARYRKFVENALSQNGYEIVTEPSQSAVTVTFSSHETSGPNILPGPNSFTDYRRLVRLAGFDSHVPGKVLWRTVITSDGRSGDFDRMFPVMMTAALPYIGGNTPRPVERILKESDPKVAKVRGTE